MVEKNQEIKIGENRLYLDENDILHVTLIGEVDEKTAIKLNEAHFKYMDMVNGKINCLVDLNNAGRQSVKVRRKGKEFLEDERVGKVALFGLHPVARVIASFVMGVTKKSDMRIFKSEKDALDWLNE